MADRQSRAHLLAAGASALLLAIVAVLVALGLMLKAGRRELTSARDSASRRPEAPTLTTIRMPDVDGVKVYWLKMVPLDGGALAVGRSANGAPVFMALDPSGVPQSQGQLPTDVCEAIDVVAISLESAIVLCANKSRLEFVALDLEGGRVHANKLPSGTLPWSTPFMHHVVGSTFNHHHFWSVPSVATSWAIGSAEGNEVPTFAALAGVREISSMAALSDSEAAIVTVENGPIEILVVSSGGQVTRSAPIASGAAEDLAMARPQVFVGRTSILVVWVQHEAQPFLKLFAPDKSVLVFRRFTFSLEPLGEPRALVADPFVGPFSVERTAFGGVVAWDQGMRGSWDVAGYMLFDAEANFQGQPVTRVPSGRLPLSIVETTAGILALSSKSEGPSAPYRTMLLKR